MTIAKRPTPAALAVLRQATALRPQRNKASDGLLPSAAHIAMDKKAGIKSDHDTGFGVDLTHDPLNGIDCKDIFQKIKADKRVKYIIFNGKIWSKDRATEGDRPYNGPNKHPHHIHVSVEENCGNDTSPWFAWMGKPTLVNKVKANLPKPLPKKENK
jgi:hypothetical protein